MPIDDLVGRDCIIHDVGTLRAQQALRRLINFKYIFALKRFLEAERLIETRNPS